MMIRLLEGTGVIDAHRAFIWLVMGIVMRKWPTVRYIWEIIVYIVKTLMKMTTIIVA